MHRKFALLFTLVALAAAPTLAQAKKGLTVDDMLAMQRVLEPDVSPDGRLVAFTVRDTDLEANRGRTDVWLASTDGAWARRHTTHPDGDSSPRFTRDGKSVLFLSSRSGSSQVWRVAVGGGEAEQLTRLPVDVNGFVPVPGSDRLVLALEVWPDAKTLEDTVKRDEELGKSKVKARAY
ncbi:MAG: PD40 domain-containing protein, partial [Deltaproteobacteria bacterium]|nr:PD40 domain-containing protein [Deltaproteobacteria bacterium]